MENTNLEVFEVFEEEKSYENNYFNKQNNYPKINLSSNTKVFLWIFFSLIIFIIISIILIIYVGSFWSLITQLLIFCLILFTIGYFFKIINIFMIIFFGIISLCFGLIGYNLFSKDFNLAIVNAQNLSNLQQSQANGMYKIILWNINKTQIGNANAITNNYKLKELKTEIIGLRFKIDSQQDLNILKEILSGKIKPNLKKLNNNYDYSKVDLNNYFKNLIIYYK